jgi:DNA repair exonuclease SbcCD ATPase subunit
MPRLMRAHFASIGHRDARLAPLTLDLRAGGVGSGADTVLWLRNGGGKSSLLNLFFSVLRPRLRDFLGATAEGKSRRLADYVKESDLAVVVTEWDLTPRLDRLDQRPADICLLGQVLSWRGQQRSADDARLRRLYFGLRAGPGLTLDDLPIQGLAAPATSFEALRDWLSAHKSSRPELEITYTDNLQTWEKHLTHLGIDPELIRVQIRMNAREGAADELFRFGSPREFIDFFLELAMDFDKASDLSANLDALRSSLQRRPTLLRERELLDAVHPALERLAAAARERQEAEGARDHAVDLAARTASALRARAGDFERRLHERRADQAAAADEARRASNDADARRRWAGGLERLAVRLAVEEAERDHKAAKAARDAADRHLRALDAARVLAELRDLDAQLRAKQEALDRESAELAPIKSDLDLAGSRLRAVLRRSDAAHAEAEDEANHRHRAADAEQRRIDALRLEITRNKANIEAEIRALRKQLAARDAAREALSRDKHLDSYEDAGHALTRWQQRHSAAEARREGALAHQQQLTGARESGVQQLRQLEAERSEAVAAHRALTKQLQEAHAWSTRLRLLAPLRELQGVDEADLEQPRLVALLRDAAEHARRQQLTTSVDAAEDRRSLDALERDGLLPPSRDVDELLSALQARKIQAHSGLRYLVDNHPAAAVFAQLTADPQRHAGVVLMRPADLSAAAALDPAQLRLRAPVQLSTALDPAPEPAPTPPTVILPDPALHDRSAADQRRRELADAHARREQELRELHAREDAHRRAADDLERFLEKWGRGKLDQQEASARDLADRTDRLTQQIDGAERRQRELDEQLQRARDEQRDAEADLKAVDRAIDRLNAFIDAHDRHADGWRDQLDRHQQREAELTRALEDADAEHAASKEALHLTQAQIHEIRRDRADLQKSIRAVAYHAADVDVDPGDLREADARARYDELRDLYERRTSESRLQWELDQLRGDHQKRSAELDTKLAAGLDRAEVEAACDRGELPRARARAEADLDAKRHALARAEHALEHAKSALREQQRRRDADDLPPEHQRPATSEAARELAKVQREEAAAIDAIEQQHRQREHSARDDAEALDRRLERLQTLSKNLHELTGDLPDRPPRALAEDDDSLTRDLDHLRSQLRSARQRADDARVAAHTAAEQVRHIASDERFTGLRSQARERLRGDLGELQERAEEFALEVATTRTILQRDLDQLDEHRRILLGNLVDLGENAAYLLKQATRASVLPEHLDAWSGRSYLKIDLTIPEAEADKRARLEPLIDRLMESATLPGPVKLVQETVFELAGGRHDAFRVTVLKPDAVLRHDPVPIDQLSTFSRGQQLTASILLYCTIVQLRARRRGRGGRLSDAGVLILDNPIGTCSNRALLDLQRMIAQRMGVQLIYTTGVEDADAIAVLPNTIRLRNAHRDRRSGDLHVTHEGDERESALFVARIESRSA